MFFEKNAGNEVGRLDPDLFIFVFIEAPQHLFIYFDRSLLRHTTETNFRTFHTVALEICLLLIFYERVWNYLLRHILCMIFQEKYFSCYTLLTGQILLSGCLCF